MSIEFSPFLAEQQTRTKWAATGTACLRVALSSPTIRACIAVLLSLPETQTAVVIHEKHCGVSPLRTASRSVERWIWQVFGITFEG
ncbi:hypothetical protein [Arthrobacter sp. E3]|uniref:hypothetical protein n=1 Tax=Arthrobacter sp. E3 TaxID=517402 RepID=UPI001A952042|nr:hypothetical protein [Arthrobacter sp. E3]